MRTDFAQLRRLPDLLFPRSCPFCGSLLGPDALQGTVCPACVPEEMRLQHIPARLPEGEHDFYAVREAAAAYYYEDIVRTAVLRCKRGGCFWYARELADRVAVLVFGALPAKQPGKMPQYAGVTALPLYSCIVPVPPRQPLPGMPGLPLLLALALAFYCLWRAGWARCWGFRWRHRCTSSAWAARRRSLPASSACKTPGARLAAAPAQT